MLGNMTLNKLTDALCIVEVLSLAASDMLDDTAELGLYACLFTMFIPNAYNKGVFSHTILPNAYFKPIFIFQTLIKSVSRTCQYSVTVLRITRNHAYNDAN